MSQRGGVSSLLRAADQQVAAVTRLPIGRETVRVKIAGGRFRPRKVSSIDCKVDTLSQFLDRLRTHRDQSLDGVNDARPRCGQWAVGVSAEDPSRLEIFRYNSFGPFATLEVRPEIGFLELERRHHRTSSRLDQLMHLPAVGGVMAVTRKPLGPQEWEETVREEYLLREGGNTLVGYADLSDSSGHLGTTLFDVVNLEDGSQVVRNTRIPTSEDQFLGELRKRSGFDIVDWMANLPSSESQREVSPAGSLTAPKL